MRNDALETQLERSLDVADDRVDDGVDGAPGRIRDDGVLAVEVEHHRLAVRARERLQLHIARLHDLELGETRAHGLQERGEVLVWRLSGIGMKSARQRRSARPAGTHTISINFSPLARSSSASSTACRLRFPVPVPSSFPVCIDGAHSREAMSQMSGHNGLMRSVRCGKYTKSGSLRETGIN